MVRIVNGEVVPDDDVRARNLNSTSGNNPGPQQPRPAGQGSPGFLEQLNEPITVFGYTTVPLFRQSAFSFRRNLLCLFSPSIPAFLILHFIIPLVPRLIVNHHYFVFLINSITFSSFFSLLFDPWLNYFHLKLECSFSHRHIFLADKASPPSHRCCSCLCGWF